MRLPDALGVRVWELVAVSDEVRVSDALGVLERVAELLLVAVLVPDALAVAERELLDEGVPVWLAVDVGLWLSLTEAVVVRVGVRLPVLL